MSRLHALAAAVLVLTLLLGGGLPARAQDAAELSPTERTAYAKGVREAATLVRERRFVEARQKLEVLLAQRPSEPQARFLMAVADTEEGRTDAAIAAFESLTRDYPELPEPWNNLAALYVGRGDYDGARLALQTAVAAAPDWAVAHENLGDLYAALARKQYERAAALDRKSVSAATKLRLVRELLAPPAGAVAPAGAKAPATAAAIPAPAAAAEAAPATPPAKP